MFKKSIFCVCMFFVISTLSFSSAFASDFGFLPSSQTVFQGDYASVDITLETYNFGVITGYDLLVEYDPFILNIENDDISIYSVLEGVDVYSSSVDVDPNSGTIYLSLWHEYYSDNLTVPLPFLSLATLNFFASEVGTSDLEFSSITLYDEFSMIDPFNNDFLFPSVDLNIANQDDIDELAAITTNGEITVSACPPPDTSATPEPSTFLLLGISSLIGLGYSKRKKVS